VNTILPALEALLKLVGEEETVIMAWDEAHLLCTSEDTPEGEPWSKYSVVRSVMRFINNFPFWGVFLATAGEFGRFMPPAHMSMTGRLITGKFKMAIPFSALGFDQISNEKPLQRPLTLSVVSSLEFQITLGRPLWVFDSSSMIPLTMTHEQMANAIRRRRFRGPEQDN
jgi:hypothetical protein